MLEDERCPRTPWRWNLIAGVVTAAVLISGALTGGAPATAAPVTSATFTVAPDGDDAADGSPTRPFRTIERARDAVRAANDSMTADIHVVLEGGTYPIAETIEFAAEDSGTNGHRVFYSAADGEKPVLDAGTAVTGWTRHDGDIWKAPLTRDSKLRALYVGDQRAIMAEKTVTSRGCSGTYSITAGQAPWAWESGSECDGISYSASDVPAISRNVSDVEIESATTWTTALVGVREVATESNGSRRVLRLQQPGAAIAMGALNGDFATDGTHVISNAYEFLDTTGEFYFDRAAQAVFYQAAPGQDMAATPVVAPNELETVLDIAGTSTSVRVENLSFEGLTIAHSDWNLASVDGSMVKEAQQSNLSNTVYAKRNFHEYEYRNVDLAPAAVQMANASGLAFVRNTVAHTGADGLSLMNDVVDSDLTGNTTRDIGGTAVSIGHPQHVYIGDGTATNGEKYAPGIEGAPKDIRVRGNFLHGNGALFPGSSAVAAYFLDGLVFEHNRVEKTTWNGISLGWGWKDFDGAPGSIHPGVPTTVARDNIVRFNAFYDTMSALSDSGPIYTLGAQPGTMITRNYIQGVRPGHTYGLHPDEGSAYITYDQNVLNIPQAVVWALNSGNWGRQGNLTITNTWAPNNKIFESVVPQSRIDNLKVFPDYIWPREAYEIAVQSGLEREFEDLLAPAALSSADQILPASVRVESGTTSIPVRRSADPTRSLWIAPEGTTTFSPSPTITTATGTAESIAVPTTPGTYRLFTLDSTGAASSPSTGVIWRTTAAPVDATITETRAGRCIDVGASDSRAVLADCDSGADQKYTYTADRELRVLGKCLSAEGGSRSLATPAMVATCTGSVDQKWELISNGNIVGVGAGLCLDGLGGGSTSGTRIGLWSCSDAINQVWRITSAPVEASVTLKAESRCLAGKAYIVTTLRNDAATSVTTTVTSAYGEKSFAQVAAGRSVTAATNSRLASIPAGQVRATVTSGATTSTATAPYPAIACR
ncbi:ricin-type beta-trefoil lectin domain protein [Microbacteriaceae bacterium VKM Ac-2855]|nr:ricin-type beta-trefoil lectin domain protein [Microbacteriaceae bacterium VKM Ac-2855]